MNTPRLFTKSFTWSAEAAGTAEVEVSPTTEGTMLPRTNPVPWKGLAAAWKIHHESRKLRRHYRQSRTRELKKSKGLLALLWRCDVDQARQKVPPKRLVVLEIFNG